MSTASPLQKNDAPVCGEDRLYKYKNRYLIHAVHPRPDSGRLIFVFSGVDATAGICRMSYFGLGSNLNATVVHIMDNFGSHGCYLLNVAGDQQIRNATISLIRELQNEFSCPPSKTSYIGTSKGATTAIAYALMTGGGSVICGEPQVMLGDFIYSEKWEELEQWRSLAYAILGRVEPDDKEVLNNLFIDIVKRYGSRFSGKITIHVGNTGYYEKHILHLLNIANETGLSDKISTIKHNFISHDEVVPIFLDAISQEFSHSEHVL